MNRSERGSVVILVFAVVVLAAVVALGVARAGHAAGDAARADTAADTAALAAADALARYEGSVAAGAAAQEVAASNGAVVTRCDCTGDHAEVVVEIAGAIGRARAEVHRACQYAVGTCD
jgi:hypothetical protein